MALTLLEAAKLAKTPQARALIELYANETDLMRVLPFETEASGVFEYNQESALPSVAFRGLNEAFAESTGVVNPQVETMAIAGGDLDVDRELVKRKGAGVRATHEAMKVKSLSHYISHQIVKGDLPTTPKGIQGLQGRCLGTQLRAAGSTSGGDALSLYLLDGAISATYQPNYLLMSRAMKIRFAQAMRSPTVGGYITMNPDQFGRQVMRYQGYEILVADGLTDVNASLAFDESNPGGGSAVGTSIYVLSLGPGRCHGIQQSAPDVRDLGEQNSKPVFRTRIDWSMGLAIPHNRAVTRLYGIKDAAIVA